MAATSDPPRKSGFSVSNPGAKEYVIVGGLALAVFLVWRWWQNRQPAPAPSAASDTSLGGTAPATATGLSTADLLLWMKDHSSSATTTTTTTSGGKPPKARCKPGFHFEPEPGPGHGTLIVGTYHVRGGICVPDRKAA
jgi:hypothetical protein